VYLAERFNYHTIWSEARLNYGRQVDSSL